MVLSLRDNYTAVIKKARRYTSAFDKDVQKMTARLDKASAKKRDIRVKNSAAMKALTAVEKKIAPMRNIMVKVAANVQHFKNQIKPVTDTVKKIATKGWTVTVKLQDGHPWWRAGRGHRGAVQGAPGPFWAISPDCEEALNRYKGYRTLYQKETLPVAGITWLPNEITAMPAGVTEVPAMIYIMNVGEPAVPSDYYLDTIVQGYRSVGFHVRYLAEAVRRLQRRKKRVKK